MLALLASVLVVAYLVVPGVLFRAVFSLFVPLKAFDRTRTQEFGYSVVVCALPLLLALVLVGLVSPAAWPFPFPDNPEQRNSDYKTVLLASFAESFGIRAEEFWAASLRLVKRHGRVLFWYLGFIVVEAMALGFLASRWGRIQLSLAPSWPRTERLLSRLLLANVSEWHVLLTDFLFPGTLIHADVLTAEDRLYRGEVLTYTRGREGNLTGLYLNNAERYDRVGLLSDRAARSAKPAADYWKPVPGRRLFIFADKVFTLNIRPQTTLAAASQVALELDRNATVAVQSAATASSADQESGGP